VILPAGVPVVLRHLEEVLKLVQTNQEVVNVFGNHQVLEMAQRHSTKRLHHNDAQQNITYYIVWIAILLNIDMMSFMFLIVMLGVIMLIAVTPLKHEPEPRIRFGEFSTLEMALGGTLTV
jgi:hypothetical protein